MYSPKIEERTLPDKVYDKRSGRYFGKCPFCGSKTRTLSMNPETGLFFCYACGATGTGSDLDRGIGHYPSFGYARDNTENSDAESWVKVDPARLYDIYREAAMFYYLILTGSDNAGRKYFASRGIGKSQVRAFGLGYALSDGQSLYRALIQKGFTLEEMIGSGLVHFSKEKGSVYDMFRNRVIFPIMDSTGRVIAFGGRALTDMKPKYINSAESPIFSKRRNLYGFPYEAEHRGESLIVCEGYMDLIALKSAGFADSCAVLGTALTEEHTALIRQRYKNVLLALDSDAAGIHAMKRSITELEKAGLNVRVLSFKPAKDPDEFIRKYGGNGMQERIRAAITRDEFLARNASTAGDFLDILMQHISLR